MRTPTEIIHRRQTIEIVRDQAIASGNVGLLYEANAAISTLRWVLSDPKPNENNDILLVKDTYKKGNVLHLDMEEGGNDDSDL